MSRSLKIFVACFLGGLTGALIALNLSPILWWLGLIVGGTVGYFTFEFRLVIRAVQAAWKQVTGWKLPAVRSLIRSLIYHLLAIICSLMMLFDVLFPVSLILPQPGSHSVPDPFGFARGVGGMALGFLLGFAACGLVVKNGRFDGEQSIKGALRLFLYLNPLSFFVFWPLWLIWQGLRFAPHYPRWVYQGTCWFWGKVAWFVKLVFVQIHSDVRLLCFLDSALGAGIGYFAGDPLMGGIAGGLLGVLNFELVSKRWLKLVPIKVD